MEKEVQTMVEIGVVEWLQSEWHIPMVLVPNPSGTLWFCIDFWRVNMISSSMQSPMPWIDKLLDRLGTARYIMTLDLTKGYILIPLDPSSTERGLCLPLPTGLYHFTQMPLSLNGAPATFQR